MGEEKRNENETKVGANKVTKVGTGDKKEQGDRNIARKTNNRDKKRQKKQQ